MSQELATEYVKYFNSDSSRINAVEETIEDMLTRLEELKGTIDMIRTEDEKKFAHIKDILQLKNGLVDIISRIDAMEMFISRVHRDLNTLETKLLEAEQDFPERFDNKFKNLFKPILSKISPEIVGTSVSVGTATKFKKPEVFRTEQFFTEEDPVNN